VQGRPQVAGGPVQVRAPDPEVLAQALHVENPTLAVDLLRLAGYTKRAALKALQRGRSLQGETE
jgi:hypothetical protein